MGQSGDPGVMVQWLAQLGVGGAFAALLFHFYRKDVRSYSELWQAQATENRKMTETVIALVATTTSTMTENTQVLNALHRRIDRLDVLRLVGHDEQEKEHPT